MKEKKKRETGNLFFFNDFLLTRQAHNQLGALIDAPSKCSQRQTFDVYIELPLFTRMWA